MNKDARFNSMKSYLTKRLLLTIPVIIGVITLVFWLIHLIPGDPVELMLGETARAADKLSLRHQLGLDKPLFTQYLDFISGIAHGNLGYSLHTDQPVLQIILQHLPATIELSIAAMVIALLICFPLGIASAMKQYSLVDNGSMILALLGISMPNFWLGPMLIILFAIKLDWLPVGGRGSLAHLILPAITLGTAMAAILTRMIRSSLIEVAREDYITAARAKGSSRLMVYLKHALRNALMPVVTIVGLQLGSLLTGSIITETIFAWPGIGRLTITAINSRDYPLVQGCVLVMALGYVLINLLTDLAYGWIDPRIRYGKEYG
jgi:peptide/nickel transport system permease protein